MGDQLVHMEVIGLGATMLHFSAVYATCTRVGMRGLWDAMEAVKKQREPWLIAGDFNVITSISERLGGAPPNARNMKEFNDAIFNCGLFSICFDGQPFMWTNGVMW